MQISFLTGLTTAFLYPVMSYRGSFSFFLIWAGFEWIRRATYRKEIPCPHCGFDASWYKKDVKVARRLVEEHWVDKKIKTTSEDELAAAVGSASQEGQQGASYGQGY